MQQTRLLFWSSAMALGLQGGVAFAADTTPPTVPTNVTAVSNSASSITVSWAKSTDNVGVAGYKVKRSDGKVYTTTALSYTNSGLTAAKTYTYTVQAYDAAGLTSAASSAASKRTWGPGHYVLLAPWRDPSGKSCGGRSNYTSDVERQLCLLRQNGADILNSHFKGVQMRYYWKDLETSEGVYNFAPIRNDLAYLESVGKRMILVLQDIRWGSSSGAIPAYLKTKADAGGGMFQHPDGAKPKRYNDVVSARLQAIIRALGAEFDGRASVEAFSGEESVLGVNTATSGAGDYVATDYLREMKEQMTAASQAFPTGNVIQYINYFDKDKSGANLCGDNVYAASYLACIARHAKNLRVGLGGPDIKPNHQGLMENGYLYYPEVTNVAPLGTAVQGPDYQYAKANGYTPSDIIAFGVNDENYNLGLNYIFWLGNVPRTDETNDLEFLDDVWPLFEPSAAVPPINMN